MKFITLVAASSLLTATMLYGEVKIDDVEATYGAAAKVEASRELEQHIDLGFANTTGNTETLNLNAQYGMSFTTTGYEGRDLKTSFDTSAYITENNGVRDNEEYKAYLGLEQSLSNEWLGYGFVSWLQNTFRNYDHKILVGAGIGKNLIDDGTQRLKVKFGGAYNYEAFSDGQPTRKFASTTEYVEYRYRFNAISEGYIKFGAMQNLENFSNDYEFTSVVGFDFAVAERVTLTLQGEVAYDNLPATGFQKTDTKTIARVGYHF